MKTNRRNGYALVTVMGIMAVLSITFATLLHLGQQDAFFGKRLRDLTKASAYAEAGVEFAYAIIRDDFDRRNTPSAFFLDPSQTNQSTLTSVYGDGSFTLSIVIDASLDGQLLQIGFQNIATNYEGSGIFYDNINFAPSGPVATEERSFGAVKSLFR